MTRINQTELARWRNLDAADVIAHFAEYAKPDNTFIPIKNKKTSRWNINIQDRGDYELLFTGPKFWDNRSKQGGGGAIDLVMYLYGVDFRTAAAMLQQKSL